MTLPEIPSFFLVSASIVLLLALATGVLFLYMAVSSMHLFADFVKKDRFADRCICLLKKGRLKSFAFISILAVQFAVATGSLLWINDIRFVPYEAGLGAYTGHNTTQLDVDLALIPICNWQDRFPPSRMNDIMSGEDVPLRNPARANPTDQRFDEFQSLTGQLRESFSGEAPGAIANLTERLTPIFAILSAFFLVCARSVVRKDENPDTYLLSSVLLGLVLAFCFSMLGYYVILGYHASVEVSAAIAAGRLLCVAHVAPFFLAQVQTLVVSAIGLLLIFLASPNSIFRKL